MNIFTYHISGAVLYFPCLVHFNLEENVLSTKHIKLTNHFKSGTANHKYLHSLESGLPLPFVRWTSNSDLAYQHPVWFRIGSSPWSKPKNNRKKGPCVIFSSVEEKILTYPTNTDEDETKNIKTASVKILFQTEQNMCQKAYEVYVKAKKNCLSTTDDRLPKTKDLHLCLRSVIAEMHSANWSLVYQWSLPYNKTKYHLHPTKDSALTC